MSSKSPQSFGIHITKQRQQQESKEADQAVKGNEGQTQHKSPMESQPCETIGTKRSYPWPELVGSQPRLESSTHARSVIGVHSILNPTEDGNSQTVKRPARENSNGGNPNMELLRPPTLPPSPQRRSSSSPLLAPISKSSTVKQYFQHGGGSSVSPPHNPPRRIITPVSPAVRYSSVSGSSATNTGSVGAISGGGSGASTAAGKVSVLQSPFVQDLSAGVYSTQGTGPGISAPSTRPVESSSTRFSPKLAIPIPGRNPPPPVQLSRHSTPTFHHSRHLSGGFATNPSSQASSPSTPHSTYSSFAQSSPSVTSGLLPPPGQALSLSSSVESASQSPYMGMDPLSRTPSRMSGPRYGDDHHQPGVAYPGPADQHQQHQYNSPMIPVTIDLKSGSRSQAEKRKANSDASRRFRNRKKNEAVLEQKITQLNEQLQYMTEARDHYRTERDFFRETLSRQVGTSQMPSRPPSPSPMRRPQQSTASPGEPSSPAEQQQQSSFMSTDLGGEMMSKSISTGTTSSSLASGTPHVLHTPVSGSESLSYLSSAAGQHPSDSWQGNSTTASSDYQHPYRDDLRYTTSHRRP